MMQSNQRADNRGLWSLKHTHKHPEALSPMAQAGSRDQHQKLLGYTLLMAARPGKHAWLQVRAKVPERICHFLSIERKMQNARCFPVMCGQEGAEKGGGRL